MVLKFVVLCAEVPTFIAKLEPPDEESKTLTWIRYVLFLVVDIDCDKAASFNLALPFPSEL